VRRRRGANSVRPDAHSNCVYCVLCVVTHKSKLEKVMNPLDGMSPEALCAYAATLSRNCTMFDADHYGSKHSSLFEAVAEAEHLVDGNLLVTVAVPIPGADASVPGAPSGKYDGTGEPYSSASEDDSEHSLSEDESEEVWSADEIGDADVEPDADALPLGESDGEEGDDDADDGAE
jgi:hypothetical protein